MTSARIVARFVSRLLPVACLLIAATGTARAQAPAAPSAVALYRDIRAFSLTGGSVRVQNLALARDRAQMVFTGSFYFAAPVQGHVTGAVFIGQGTFRAEVPPSRFEEDNVRRLLHTTVIESDFKTAVLRFSDDTFDRIGKDAAPGQSDPEAARLASEFEGRTLKETGSNIAARLAISLLNGESPGFFMAEFDKGRRGRFACLLDYQARIPVANFAIDGGEKGVIYSYKPDYFGTDVWMAFYALDDYTRGRVNYSDAFNLVNVVHYDMDVDLRDPRKALGVTARMELKPLAGGVRAVPFRLSKNLGVYHDDRLKLGLRVKSAQLSGGAPVEFVQEDWEGGFTLYLAQPCEKARPVTVEVTVSGDFLQDIEGAYGNEYPLSNETWYPRHGYLERSTFDLTFHHDKNLKVVSVGDRLREEAAPGGKTGEVVTEYRLDVPVALVTFALGPFERHVEMNEAKSGPALPVEIYTMPASIQRTQHAFVLAEMKNSINYFSALFGQYPFPVFRAGLHPFGFGQGFPTMLMIPSADRADMNTFQFIAHETSHQWWGHIVLWRSYRDQWLSEGFARYSGLLYGAARDRQDSGRVMLQQMRDSLVAPPRMALGVGSGRLTDVGAIIMGRRLATRETVNAYSTLVYNKGGLVLRMLHFLFTDASGNGQPFFDMMSDFVRRYSGGSAATDDFIAVANEHFAKTALAQRLGMKDLNWFFLQWVFETALPTYRMEYWFDPQPDGSVLVKGTVFQANTPAGEKWFMPLPVVMDLGNKKKGRALVYALGPETPFSLRVGSKPASIELDPDLWVLSEKTSTKEVRPR